MYPNIRHIACIIFILLFVQPVNAQESNRIKYPNWNQQDTAQILKLIRNGYAIMFRNKDSALLLIEQAIEKSKATGFEDGIGYALSYKGMIEVNSGEFEKGFITFNHALKYCSQAQYVKIAYPSLLINMAASYRLQGDYEKANTYYFKALQLLHQHLPNDVNIIIIYSNLSSVQSSMGNQEIALSYAKKAEQLSIARNNKNTLASARMNIGALYYILEKPDSAIIYYRKALILAKELNHTDKLQTIYNNIGEYYLHIDSLTQAEKYFKRAIDIGSNAKNILRGSIMPGYSLARLYTKQHKYQQAENILLHTFNIADSVQIIEGKVAALSTYITILKATGRTAMALNQMELKELLKDSLNSIEKTKVINELDTKYKTWQKDIQIADNELQFAQQAKKLEQNKRWLTNLALFVLFGVIGTVIYYRQKRKTDKKNKEIEILKANIDGEEKERQRIARELHDGVGGLLTSAQFGLNALNNKAQLSKQDLFAVSELLTEINNEVQRTAHNLMPDVIEQHDLWQALWAYTEQVAETLTGMQIELHTSGNISNINTNASLSLYRITQELIQNAVKHSKADKLSIQGRVDEQTQKLYLSIEDNGIGFNTDGSFYGLGLKNIKERIKLLNGYITIESIPDEGTIALMDIDIQSILKRNT